MKNVTSIIDSEIGLMEADMNVRKKHLISTDTLRDRVLAHVDLDSNNDDTAWLADIGFGQAIQSRLYAHGYQSVRKGYFVNLDRCEDIDYLVRLFDNVDTATKEKEAIRSQIKRIRDIRCDGQLSFDEYGNIVIPITEEEFMEKIIADAV